MWIATLSSACHPCRYNIVRGPTMSTGSLKYLPIANKCAELLAVVQSKMQWQISLVGVDMN
jgi:hypothetical protein